MFVHEVFEAQVRETPDSVALTFEGHSLTYRELNNRANQLARQLRSLGVGPEVPVGICMERSPELVAAILGVLKAGGACIPLDPTFPQERLSFALENAQPEVILAQERLLGLLPGHRAKKVCLDTDWSSIAEQSDEPIETTLTDENLAFLIYTSGSTGQPKAVMLPHRKRDSRPSHDQEVYQMTREDRHILKSSISFTLLIREVFWPLLTGAQLIITPPGTEQDTAYLVNFIATHRITLISLTPSILKALLEEPGLRNCDSLRHVICFGEPLAHELQMRFFSRVSAELSVYYGATEAPSATFRKCKPEDPPHLVDLGKPRPGTKVYLLDNHLQPVPIGACGELYIAGRLARGYLKQPDLTAERFAPNPFSDEPGARLYKTGDLGRYLPDGNIEFLGRLDNQVKIRGFRIELGEIEAALSQHPAVQETVVLAREEVEKIECEVLMAYGEGGNQKSEMQNPKSEARCLVAYVVPNQEPVPTATELRSFLKSKLPNYMAPSAFVFLNALPLTPNGKVDRRALPVPDQSRPELEMAFVPPRDPLEFQLTKIWEEVLGIKPVGVRDNFFDLGGHSLLAVHLFAKIEKLLGKKLPLATLLQAPTVERLAAILSQQDWLAPWSSLVAIQPGGSKPPFFGVHAHEGNILFYRDLVRRLGPEQPFYGLQAQGLNGKQAPYSRVEEMAAHYVKEMRAVQAKGPYFLGGYCFGGVVAFEMGRQLYAQGEKVALVALFDAYAPGSVRLSSNPVSFRDRLRYFVKRVRLHLHNLSLLGPKEQIDYIKGRIKRITYWLYTSMGLPFPHARREMLNAMSQASRSYRPQLYQGRGTLFRGGRPLGGYDHDPQLGWGKLAAGGVEIHRISTHDGTLFLEPHVRLLAEELAACLTHGSASEQLASDAANHGRSISQ